MIYIQYGPRHKSVLTVVMILKRKQLVIISFSLHHNNVFQGAHVYDAFCLVLVLHEVHFLSAATSLLKWARDEGNPAIRSMVEKLYNITLMSATVQRQYAEQVCFQFSCSV